jgi:hypothetical protein
MTDLEDLVHMAVFEIRVLDMRTHGLGNERFKLLGPIPADSRSNDEDGKAA